MGQLARSRRRSLPSHLETIERITDVEASIRSLEEGQERIFRAIDALSSSVGASRQTNWSVVLGGIGLALALWAAAISPLQNKQTELTTIDTKHEFVDEKERERVDVIKDRQVDEMARLKMLEEIVTRIDTQGSADADKRIAILEMKVGIK